MSIMRGTKPSPNCVCKRSASACLRTEPNTRKPLEISTLVVPQPIPVGALARLGVEQDVGIEYHSIRFSAKRGSNCAESILKERVFRQRRRALAQLLHRCARLHLGLEPSRTRKGVRISSQPVRFSADLE